MLRPHFGAVVAALVFAPLARSETATFDGLPEGNAGLTFTTAGITFFGADWRFPGVPPPTPFHIDNDSGEVNPPLFTSPNALTIATSDPGPQSGFYRTGEFSATLANQIRTYASVDVFFSEGHQGNTISLEALLGGAVVGADTITLPGGIGYASRRFVVSGVDFDTIRLIGRGDVEAGCFFGRMDNVRIDFVPAPTAALTLAGAAAGLARRRR